MIVLGGGAGVVTVSVEGGSETVVVTVAVSAGVVSAGAVGVTVVVVSAGTPYDHTFGVPRLIEMNGGAIPPRSTGLLSFIPGG